MATLNRDVFILGSGYCGSTLLGNALNGHSDVAYVGETSRLPFFNIGVPFRGCFLCKARKDDCPVFSEELLQRLEDGGAGRAMELLREAVGAPVVVDGSKSGQWLAEVIKSGGLSPQTRILLTIRNPFAFAHSARKNSGTGIEQATINWRNAVFHLLRQVNSHGIPYMVIRYEEFAYEPKGVLERVCGFLDLDFSPEMLEFWTSPIHAVGGNPGAYVWYGFDDIKHFFPTDEWREGAREYSQRSFGGWVDDKWVKNLTDEEITQIGTFPGVQELAAMMGYHMQDLLRSRYGSKPPFKIEPVSFGSLAPTRILEETPARNVREALVKGLRRGLDRLRP